MDITFGIEGMMMVGLMWNRVLYSSVMIANTQQSDTNNKQDKLSKVDHKKPTMML